MKKYYKLVSQNNNSWATFSKYAVRYEVGKWVKPKLKGSRLFVFTSLEAAMARANFYDKIYECEVKCPIKPHYVEMPKDLYKEESKDSYKTRWKLFNRLIRQHKKAGIPVNTFSGTVYVKAVKLGKIIKNAGCMYTIDGRSC